MKDKQFDHIINDKLNSLRANVNQADWGSLQSKLEMDMQSDPQFDQIIDDKLSSLRANTNHSDWASLQSMIEMDLQFNTQSDTQFDSTISDKVAQLSTGMISTPDWDSFSQKLNQTGEFDQTIKQKLNHIPTTKVSEHWLLLQERLQGIRDLKQSILRFKVGESILMMSLLLCFINLAQYLVPITNHKSDAIALLEDTETSTTNQIAETKLVVESKIEETNFSADQLQVVINEGAANGVSDNKIAQVSSTRQSIYQDIESSIPTVQGAIPILGGEVNGTHSREWNKVTTSQRGSVIGNQAVVSVPSMLPILTYKLENNQKAQAILEIEVQSVESKEVVSQLDEKQKVNSRFAIHTLVGVGVDQITTPGDERFYLDEYQHYAFNSNVGLRLSYDLNNWSFETGLSLEHKGYKPKYLQDTIRVQNEAVVLSLESIDFEIISVPLIVKRSVTLNDNFAMYGIAGLEYIHISKESYNINEKNTDLIGIGKELESVSDLEYKVNSPIIIDHSMNYTVGLGIIKSMNPIVDVYGQTVYRGQINSNGIGVNQDRFKSLSLQAGIKLRLANNN